MNILFVTHYSELLGANRSLITLIQGLKKFGCSSIVLAPEHSELSKKLQNDDVRILSVSFHNWVNTSRRITSVKEFISFLIYKYKALKELKNNNNRIEEIFNTIKNENIDLVYTNSSITDFGYNLAKKLKVPHVWHIREDLKGHYNVIPLVGWRMYYKLIQRSNLIITISGYLKKNIQKHISKSTNVEIVYNGIIWEEEIVKITNKQKNEGKNKKYSFTFLMLGALYPQKRYDEAISALAVLKQKQKLPVNTKLIIAGPGNKNKYTELAYKLNLINEVIIMGYVDNPKKLYQKCDAFINCSRNEGMGRVTIEAMAYGLPVIAHDSGATSELIKDNWTGFLYKNGAENLADKMSYVIENRNNLNSFIERSISFVEENFTNEIYSKKIFNLIERTKK